MKVTVQYFLFKYVKKTHIPKHCGLMALAKNPRTIKSHVNVFIFRHGPKKVWLNRWMGTPEVKVSENSHNKVQHFSLSIVF